jgi:hypothetical protein
MTHDRNDNGRNHDNDASFNVKLERTERGHKIEIRSGIIPLIVFLLAAAAAGGPAGPLRMLAKILPFVAQ